MFIQDDEIRLSAILEKPENAEGCPLVIVLHGFTSAKDRPHTVRAAAAMREAGFATLRMDLYGHGESDGEFRNHTLHKWISNVMAAIDWARGEGYTDLYLSGHSQGGLVATMAGSMEADRIRGLILRAPAFMIPRCCREGNLLGTHIDPKQIPDSVPVIKGLELDGNYVRVAQTVFVEEAAERFRNPVLILHGDEDDTVPLSVSQDMAKHFANCDLAVMAGETHHFDRHPEQMETLIRDWMRKQR